MKAKLAYCPRCAREVRVLLTEPPLHGGHANLPDAPQLICLDCGVTCSDVCALTNVSMAVMRSRLHHLDLNC